MPRTRRPGRPLTPHERRALHDYIAAVDLERARIHDHVPWYLLNGFIGITRGRRIYFRPGAYDPATPAGIALLAHELVHVRQYREGMNWFSYLLSALRGYSASRFEIEAFKLQRRVLRAFRGDGT